MTRETRGLFLAHPRIAAPQHRHSDFAVAHLLRSRLVRIGVVGVRHPDDGIRRGTLWELDFEYDESGTLLTIIYDERIRFPCEDSVCEFTNAPGVTTRLRPSGSNASVEVLNHDGSTAVPVRACPWTSGVGSDCD